MLQTRKEDLAVVRKPIAFGDMRGWMEALRAQVPATTLYVADRVDADDRVKEALRIATGRRLPLLEVPRSELDRLTGGAVHQGLALQVPPYKYAHPDDRLGRVQPLRMRGRLGAQRFLRVLRLLRRPGLEALDGVRLLLRRVDFPHPGLALQLGHPSPDGSNTE